MAIFKEADFYLLGSGTLSFLDMTLGTQHLISTVCKTVYYLYDLPSFENYLKKLKPDAENLAPLYADGRNRLDIYEDIVRRVLETPSDRRPVAFLQSGHPLVCSTISERIIEECGRRGFSLEIVPAVSALDRLYADLKLDPCRNGLQIFDARWLMHTGYELNPKSACLILQIGALVPEASRQASSKPEHVRTLKEYLLRFYGPDHEIRIAETAVEPGFESRALPFQLGALEDAAPYFNYNATLYLPEVAETNTPQLQIP